MLLYRAYLSGTKEGKEIYTKKDVIKTAAHFLRLEGIDGFTIIDSIGYWEGEQEKSYILEIATYKDLDTVNPAINSIRLALNQDAIMVQYPDLSINFIDSKFIEEGEKKDA